MKRFEVGQKVVRKATAKGNWPEKFANCALSVKWVGEGRICLDKGPEPEPELGWLASRFELFDFEVHGRARLRKLL